MIETFKIDVSGDTRVIDLSRALGSNPDTMNRRELLATTGTLIATTVLSEFALAAVEDSADIKHVVETYYALYRQFDRQKYRAMLTDDYLLLENGEIMDAAADIAAMPKPEDQHKRTDRFDFRSIHVAGDTAYAIYFLNSEISDKKNGTRSRRWLESIILRRAGNSWQVALLHSTRIRD